jgi:hypothetical protein
MPLLNAQVYCKIICAFVIIDRKVATKNNCHLKIAAYEEHYQFFILTPLRRKRHGAKR